jgi:PTH1 family peptidyl-tRNA hydrolase
MNLAGGVVQELVGKLGVNLNHLIVVHDDLDLEAGLIRVKRRGGSGGHNGIRSIVTALGTGEFIRLKVGIGRPLVGQEAADFVLSPFLPSETSDIEAAVTQAVDAAECLVTQGPVVAMNRFNKRNKEVDEL